MTILDLIRSSRVHLHSKPVHNEIPRIFKSAKRQEYISLAMVNSINMECEMVGMNGKNYLIYDMNVSRNFDLINRILHHERRNEIASKYLIRLVSQAYFNLDKVVPSGYLAIWTHGKFTPDDEGMDPDYVDLLHFQEFFIMLHEIEHYKFSQLPDDQRQSMIRAARKDYHNELKNLSVKDEQWETISELSRDVQKGFNQLKDFIDRDWNQAKPSDFVKQLKRHAIDNILSKDGFIEELLCDKAAYLEFLNRVSMDKKEMIISEVVFSALNNLRILGEVLHFTLKDETNESHQTNHFYYESNLRMIFLRSMMFRHIHASLGEDSYKNIKHHLTIYQEKLITAFTNPIYMQLPSWIKTVRKQNPGMFEKELGFLEEQKLKEEIIKYY